MSARFFGTDGIRDRVDGPLLRAAFLRALGLAWGERLCLRSGARPPRVVVGRDTRESGAAVLQALGEGLVRHNVEIFDGGIAPTPAIAYAVKAFSADGGVAITASHNPATDNGIKLFDHEGIKFRDEEERALEEGILVQLEKPWFPGPTPLPMTPIALRDHYRAFVTQGINPQGFPGISLVLDGAHGAAVAVNPGVLRAAGAQVTCLGDAPNGSNINHDRGSEHPGELCRQTRVLKADLGMAYDGDGDRVRFCDESGSLLDGDEALGILAMGANARGVLAKSTLVVTVMSNLGLDHSLREVGISVVRVGVGDRRVQHAMLRHGYTLGGESSGHIICGERSMTGDGLLATLALLEVLRREGKPLSRLRQQIRLYPQLMESLFVERKIPIEEIPALQQGVEAVERDLAGHGRILLRYSGTEPKLRLLVEAETPTLAADTMHRLRQLVEDNAPCIITRQGN